ncbi:MAG: SOS response-associated peptidase [Asgard group archaeon]|nr:SOS response-associated peptidase [Asgard group archaeon]
MLFQLEEFLELDPQYNIAPGQNVYAVRGIVIRDEQQRTASTLRVAKEVVPLRWGLIPFWAKDPSIGFKLINSRSETVAEKPSFKASFKSRRCLIPTDGFYEWKKTKEGDKKPYFIQMKDEQPFAFAGIWDKWKDSEGSKIESFSILTTEPNSVMTPIHNRMPVIIPPKNFDIWLNPEIDDDNTLKPMLKPYDGEKMKAYPVSTYVNSPKNKGIQCIEEYQEKTKQQKLI